MSFTLTNYWWLIIWMFVGGGMISMATPRQTELICGRPRQVWPKIFAIIVALPYCVWGGYRRNFGDTEVYRQTFRDMSTGLSDFGKYYSTLTKDKFFYAFAYLFKSVISEKPELFFLFVATVQVIIVALLYRKYSSDYWLSFFIFIASTDYLSWVMNGSRQFLAVMMIYAATPLLLKKKYVPLILVILLASMFHGSALLMLPIVFIIQGKAFNRMTLVCIAASVVALTFVGEFTTLLNRLLTDTPYASVVSDWQEWNDDGMSPIRALVYSMPTVLALVGYKNIKYEDDPLINMATNASLMTTALCIMAMGTSGIFMGRLPIYTSLYANGIMLPWAIDHIFVEKSAHFIKAMAVGAFLAFFYYQMHFAWGSI